VSHQSETPFDSIESSLEYISMLADAIVDVQTEVRSDISLADSQLAARRKEALQLVSFNLHKLSSHITASRRILNDLRTLRRLLLEERALIRRASDGK
jgi:hypothetical protein